jgi:hypothetical protein
MVEISSDAILALKPTAVPIRMAIPLLGGKARSEVYVLINKGRLDAVKDGAKTLITVASIDAYMSSLPKLTKGTQIDKAMEGQRAKRLARAQGKAFVPARDRTCRKLRKRA